MAGAVHASCVAWQGRGLLIMGAAGSGKSTLALELLAYGCTLIADDRVILTAKGGRLMAQCPDALANMIEARNIGILRATSGGPAMVVATIDLDQRAPDRLPQRRTVVHCGVTLPLILRPAVPTFGPAILQYLKHGFSDA